MASATEEMLKFYSWTLAPANVLDRISINYYQLLEMVCFFYPKDGLHIFSFLPLTI